MIDPVPVDHRLGAVPKNRMRKIMMNPISPKGKILAVDYFDANVSIAYLKSLNRDPSNRLCSVTVVLNTNLTG